MIANITRIGQAQRRRIERLPARTLAAMGGTLVDLSGRGMRVRVHAKPEYKLGSSYRVEVRSSSQCVRLTARVVWIKRSSVLSREYELGLRFTDVQPAVGRVLEHWALYGYIPSSNNVATMPEVEHRMTSGAEAPKTTELPCFYAELGLTPDACQAEIHAAYRKLAKSLHPDICRDDDAAERFAYVARVYEVLGDPIRRERYDAAMQRKQSAA
ncbi:MAG: DnaJ domain-containing protein [Phycisphaerales bacterium JB059]